MRATQARADTPSVVKNEKTALAELTQKECKSTPWLVDYFQTSQSGYDELMPGGFIFYNLMTFCPGIPLDRFRQKPFEERETIREAFRMAYEETLRCRVLNIKRGHENILWDASNGKCYIVDFTWWSRPISSSHWGEHMLRRWMLHERPAPRQ